MDLKICMNLKKKKKSPPPFYFYKVFCFLNLSNGRKKKKKNFIPNLINEVTSFILGLVSVHDVVLPSF